MTEVLANLPAELKNKVFTYTSHPVADLFKKAFLPGMLACTKVMEGLQEHFPHLTFRDMHVVTSEKQSKLDMALLWCALFLDDHKTVNLNLLKKWKETLAEHSETVDPHWFFEFLTHFYMQHHSKWAHMSVQEFYDWVEENVEFHYLEE